MLMWEDLALAEQIRAGVAEAEAGNTVDLGSFAQFLNEDDDEEQAQRYANSSSRWELRPSTTP
jgi:hypothetical protein